jgi:hypothetical protein
MTATVKSYELNDIAARLMALANVDNGRSDMSFSSAEIDLVIEHRRAGHMAWLKSRGIDVIRVAQAEAPTVDAAALPIAAPDETERGDE